MVRLVDPQYRFIGYPSHKAPDLSGSAGVVVHPGDVLVGTATASSWSPLARRRNHPGQDSNRTS